MMVIGSTVKDIMAVNITPSEKALKEESTATGMEWKVMDCGVFQFDVGGGALILWVMERVLKERWKF